MSPLPNFILYKNTIAYTNTMPITIPYLNTLPNTVLESQKLSAANQKRARKTLNFVSQSESNITSTKNSRELSARLEDPSWFSAPLGSLNPILIHGVFPPPSDLLTLLLLLEPTISHQNRVTFGVRQKLFGIFIHN